MATYTRMYIADTAAGAASEARTWGHAPAGTVQRTTDITEQALAKRVTGHVGPLLAALLEQVDYGTRLWLTCISEP